MKCRKCGAKEIDFNFTKGRISCKFCGFLIDENISNPEINFETKKNGQKEIRGQLIRKQNVFKISQQKSPALFTFGVRRKLTQLGTQLRISNEYIESAFKLFIFSINNKFKIRKSLHSLSISCLYAICRKEKTPHLLVDFSDISQTRSSKIGVEFLKFLKITRIPLPVIDPSIYIHRFVWKLNLGNKTNSVIMTALRLIAHMKRNWMSTGRKPTGLCGAAILLSTRIHGITKNQKEISKVVRIGYQALRCRLFEIEQTSIKKMDITSLKKEGDGDDKKKPLLDIEVDEEKNVLFTKRSQKDCILHKKILPSNFIDKTRQYFQSTNKNLKFRKKSKFDLYLLEKKKKKTTQSMPHYIHSDFETLIKEQIWEKMNAGYSNFMAVRSRIQKEKPYAFFALKKTFCNKHEKTR